MNTGDKNGQERRKQPRKAIRAKVDYQFQLPSGRVYGSGRAIDISRSGISFECKDYIPVGSVFNISILGLANGTKEMTAQVIYIIKIPGKSLYRSGAKFLRTDR